jgi:transcriptional regulator with XRE-family HTH domain
MTIAERVKAYRLQPPYPSLRIMAQRLGITASYLSEIERGLKIPKGKTLEKFAGFFGTTTQLLLYKEQADLRIMQISAAAVGDEVRVACLLSDGTVQMAYPEKLTISANGR